MRQENAPIVPSKVSSSTKYLADTRYDLVFKLLALYYQQMRGRGRGGKEAGNVCVDLPPSTSLVHPQDSPKVVQHGFSSLPQDNTDLFRIQGLSVPVSTDYYLTISRARRGEKKTAPPITYRSSGRPAVFSSPPLELPIKRRLEPLDFPNHRVTTEIEP